MNEMAISFNGQNYVAKYNEQSGYYEVDIVAPQKGGVYNTDIDFTDLFGGEYEDNQIVQVLAKEQIKIETNKVFMWIFDYKDFSVKDIVEIADYEINIDEETNANSMIKVLKKTTAKANDIVAIKKNNEIVFWGIIKEIQNENGKQLYEYILKYITNIFDRDVEFVKRNVIVDSLNESLYRIKSSQDENYNFDVNFNSMQNNGKITANVRNNGDNQKFLFIKNEDYYKIKIISSSKFFTVSEDNKLVQYEENNSNSQLWKIEKVATGYMIKSKVNNLYLTILNLTNGSDITLTQKTNEVNQIFKIEEIQEELIKKVGIEDFNATVIKENYISNEDTYINKSYLQLNVKTHTTKQTSVTNVENRIYNLHTWLTNCTQNYDIVYSFSIVDKKLVMTIENKNYNKELIDTQAQAISNYTEIFETDIVSKVVVLTSTNSYILYLLNDRTTTTNMNNANRAEGKIKTVFTENYEDAQQKALDTMKANSYNHNITFNYDKYIKVGTPIAIKTKESLIFDTYISAIKITQNKFYEYICGNIRIKFIDKLLKERKR